MEPVGHDPIALSQHREPALQPPFGERPLPHQPPRLRVAHQQPAQLERKPDPPPLAFVLVQPVVGDDAIGQRRVAARRPFMIGAQQCKHRCDRRRRPRQPSQHQRGIGAQLHRAFEPFARER